MCRPWSNLAVDNTERVLREPITLTTSLVKTSATTEMKKLF